jgi:hypothetical protein
LLKAAGLFFGGLLLLSVVLIFFGGVLGVLLVGAIWTLVISLIIVAALWPVFTGLIKTNPTAYWLMVFFFVLTGLALIASVIGVEIGLGELVVAAGMVMKYLTVK